MTDLATFVPTSGGPAGGPVGAAAEAPGPTVGVSPTGFCGLVSSLLGDLDFSAIGQVERAEWLRAFSDVDGAVAASRSRALAAGQAVSPRRFLERSAEMVRTTGMSTFDARQAINLADTLEEMPEAAEALATGEITTGHATVLSRGVSILNRPAAVADPFLLAAARSQGVDEFKATVAVFESEANNDTDGSRLASRQHRDRRVSWYTKSNGMVRIEADLAPDIGSLVTGVIRNHAEHLWRTEDGRTADPDGPFGSNGRHATSLDDLPDTRRTTRQRNADALAAMARHFNNPHAPTGISTGTSTGTGTTPTTVDPATTGAPPTATTGAGQASRAGRTRPDVIVAIDYDKLTTRLTRGNDKVTTGLMGGDNGLSAATDGVTLAPATIRRIACDAGIIPILLSSTGDVLDIGRRTRTITTPLRNALIIRDRGCTFPGCHQPPQLCDAHHLRHWSDGGPTNLANLALLCSAHHHIVHEGRWQTTRNPDGHLAYRSPTGTIHQTGPQHQAAATRDTPARHQAAATRDTPDDPDPP